MKNKKLFLISGAFATMFVAATIAISTAAWFSGRNKINTTDQLGGEVLQSYFHAGKGTVDKPFTITTPWHYENFVKLQYSVKQFAESGYYFEFGDKILGSETPVFYKTDINGVVDRTQTSTTLDLGGKILPPLGTNSAPFFGQVEGNNLTVKHFTVDGNGYCDVGIFGYVASATSPTTGQTQRAAINQCYWSDFTIKTKSSSCANYRHSTERGKHDDKVETGYLAGHVVEAASFTNCYVNNCEILGSNPQDAQNNTFSYYGKAEVDSIGGETGKGYDYEYHLDSEAVYRTVREDYEKFKNTPVRARTETDASGNTIKYAEYDTPLSGADVHTNPEIVDNGTRTLYPTGTSNGAIYENGDQYDLAGASRGESADRNYSLSSLGYQPLTSNSTVKEYEAFYYDSNNKPAYMPENVTRSTALDSSALGFTTKDQVVSGDQKTALQTPGDYYYYNTNDGWQYAHNANTSSEGTAGKNFTINLTCPSTLEIEGDTTQSPIEVEQAYAYLVIDDVLVDDLKQDITSKCSASRGSSHGTLFRSFNIKVSNISLNKSTYTVNLQRGRHYFGFFILFRFNTTSPKFGFACNSSASMDWRSKGKFGLTQGTFNVTQDLYDKSDSQRKLSFSIEKTGRQSGIYTTSDTVYYGSDGNRYNASSDMPVYINSATKQYSLYGTYLKDGTVNRLADSSMLWRKDEGYNTEYDDDGNPIQVHWYKWIAYFTPSMEVDYNTPTVYFADDSRLTTYVKDGVSYPGRGYQYRNMDIVGGGISFYYRNFPLLGLEIKVISIRAESSSKYSCKAVPAADIAAGSPFYATKYCPTSIVLYLKNTANAADTTDHELGKVDFQYMNISIGGTSVIDLATPSFKKGSGNFVSLEKFGKKSGSGTVDYRTTFSCTINETGAKACCYCALDKDRNILGVFDSDGNPSTGFLDASGKPIISKLLAIDTYVLSIGANSNYDISAWVTKVDFEYKAEIGYGGTFGTVGYRDSPDTISNTILNFNYNLPAFSSSTDHFSIKVKFVKQTATEADPYSGYYEITASSSIAFTLAAYNYDTANYYVKVNNTPYYTDRINVNIPAT